MHLIFRQDLFRIIGGKSKCFGGNGNDVFEIVSGVNHHVKGQQGQDRFKVSGGLSTIHGGSNVDIIDVLDADAGTSINGNSGGDFITGSGKDVSFRGGKDDDQMAISQGNVWGNLGKDIFIGVDGRGYAVIQDFTIGQDLVDIEMNGSWSSVEDGLMFTDTTGNQVMLLLGINNLDQMTSL